MNCCSAADDCIAADNALRRWSRPQPEPDCELGQMLPNAPSAGDTSTVVAAVVVDGGGRCCQNGPIRWVGASWPVSDPATVEPCVH